MARTIDRLLSKAMREKITDGYTVVEHRHDQGPVNLPILSHEIADATEKTFDKKEGRQKHFVFVVAQHPNRRRRRLLTKTRYVPLTNRALTPGRRQWRQFKLGILLPARMQRFITRTKERLQKYKSIFRHSESEWQY
jgi:hypothetical protein